MQSIVMPDGQVYNLRYAVFDYNGTLAEDGYVSNKAGIVVTGPQDAINLLLRPKRLIATLRR